MADAPSLPEPVMTVADRLKQKIGEENKHLLDWLRDAPIGIPEFPALAPMPRKVGAEIAEHNARCLQFSTAAKQVETDTVDLAVAMTADVPAKEIADRAASIRFRRYDLAKSRVALFAAKGRLCQRLADESRAKEQADADALAAATRTTEEALIAAGLSREARFFVVSVEQSEKVRTARETLEKTTRAITDLREAARIANSHSERGAWHFVTQEWERMLAGLL